MSLYTVVIADDEQPIRQGLSHFPWEKYGFRLVAAAADGNAALQSVFQHNADLLLSDIRMPVMDGLEVTAHLFESKCATHVVLLTGFQDFSYAQQAIRYNVYRLLTKPLDPTELTECLLSLHALLSSSAPQPAPFSAPIQQPPRPKPLHQPSCSDLYPRRQAAEFLHFLLKEPSLTLSLVDSRLDALLEAFSPILKHGIAAYRQALLSFLDELKTCSPLLEEQSLQAAVLQAEGSIQKSDSALGSNRSLSIVIHRIFNARASVDFEPNRMIVEQAMLYVRQNYSQPLTLETVADAVHISPSYLSVLFKKYAQTNFSKYLRSYRMERARELLTTTHAKVYEIAGQVGYPNPKYFIDLFKEQNGLSPHEYRIFYGNGGFS